MNKALLSSKNMNWCTPQYIFEKLDEEHHFTLDAAATEKSAKCKKYFTPKIDGLKQSWEGETVFCNPPYGRAIGKWVKKACEESRKPNTKVVMLIPSRTDTKYFHKYIFPYFYSIEFIKGRICFTDENGKQIIGKDGRKQNAPFPCAVVVFQNTEPEKRKKDFNIRAIFYRSRKELILESQEEKICR